MYWYYRDAWCLVEGKRKKSRSGRTKVFYGTLDLSDGRICRNNPPGPEPLTVKRLINGIPYYRHVKRSLCQGLTPTEAAAHLSVGRATIYRWISSRELRTFKRFGRLLIRVRELEKFKQEVESHD